VIGDNQGKKEEFRVLDSRFRGNDRRGQAIRFVRRSLGIDFVHHSWEGYALADMLWAGPKFRVQKP